MNMKKKVFSMLALLAVATTGAWAQGSDPDPIELTSTDGETWTLASMPAYDVELEVTYFASTPFDLTKADGSEAYGTVTFTVGGEFENTISVSDGAIAFIKSTCPGTDCVHLGAASAPGRTLVCLPNRVEIRIVPAEGQANDDGVDFVVR